MLSREVQPRSVDDTLRTITAANPGPFTLDGTRTHLVGRERPAVVDPGPDDEDHVRSVAAALEGADSVTVLLTHGHDDHTGGAESLIRLLRARGRQVRFMGPGAPRAGRLGDGVAVYTDAGSLVALHTPGHTRDHVAYAWPECRALFAGDLLMGEGETTWVGEYPGCVSDYLGSLARLRRMELDVVYPAHGPPLRDPDTALDRFEAHRRERIAQVRRALGERPGADTEELLEVVYGDTVPPGLQGAALRSLRALVEYVEAHPEG